MSSGSVMVRRTMRTACRCALIPMWKNLGMRDRRLADRIDVVAVDAGDQIVDERRYLRRRRGHEVGVQR
jgi:hypothetical protein